MLGLPVLAVLVPLHCCNYYADLVQIVTCARFLLAFICSAALIGWLSVCAPPKKIRCMQHAQAKLASLVESKGLAPIDNANSSNPDR